jgi:hypothetical protein
VARDAAVRRRKWQPAYFAVVVMTTEPAVSEPEVAFSVTLPAVFVDWRMASALPLNAARDLPL